LQGIIIDTGNAQKRTARAARTKTLTALSIIAELVDCSTGKSVVDNCTVMLYKVVVVVVYKILEPIVALAISPRGVMDMIWKRVLQMVSLAPDFFPLLNWYYLPSVGL
jgi:hypothetical protein